MTIAAIATPVGTGGIGIVRLSGPQSRSIAARMTRLVRGCSVEELGGYTCAYGRVLDEQGADLDEMVVSVFLTPHSYTGEDVVEIAAHGGIYILQRVLRACYALGARPAQAGEFTKRAFLNGKLDLTQAEAVVDLIAAQGERAAQAALSARDGALYGHVRAVCESLMDAAAHLAAWMDYPEDEIELVDGDLLAALLADNLQKLDYLLASYGAGRIIREGIETAIIGRPNVGKSTLMNLMAGYTRSIVADLAGTTRDVVSDSVRLGELVLHLSDTAGIRETHDPIERMGVELAEQRLRDAQLVLAVFDGGDQLDGNDQRIMQACKGRVAVALVNKSDLPDRIDQRALEQAFGAVVRISARAGEGIDQLRQEVERLFLLGSFDAGAALLANERQRDCVLRAREELAQAAQALAAGVSYDAVCVCIESAVAPLLELTGERVSDEVVARVFSRFCVGK